MAGNFSLIWQQVDVVKPSRFDQRVSVFPYLNKRVELLQRASTSRKCIMLQDASAASSYATRATLYQRVSAGDPMNPRAKVVEVIWHG